MIINGQRYEAEPAVEAYVKDLQAENEEQRREIINCDTDLQQHEDENMQLWYDNNKLKAENARLEEGYQKSLGVIAATDCTECKKDAEPIKHGELWVSCNERMPETLTETLDGRYSECCLVFAEETEWIGMAYYRTNNNKSWWEFADAQNKPKIDWAEITHWMPLSNCPNCGAKMYGGTDRQWTDKITAGEYQPVKHGHFERFSDDEQFKVLQEYGIPFNGTCSICTSMMFDTDKFCGECGAKMDGGADE